VHPDWVYCSYHYLEGHEFTTSEDELRHFLKKIIEPNWKWSQQYQPDAQADKEKETDERKSINHLIGVARLLACLSKASEMKEIS